MSILGWARESVSSSLHGERPSLLKRGSSLKEVLDQEREGGLVAQNGFGDLSTSKGSSKLIGESAHARDNSLAAHDQTAEALESLLQKSRSLSQALDLIEENEEGECKYCHGERVRTTIRMMIHVHGHGGTSCSECQKPLFDILTKLNLKKMLQVRRAPSRTARRKNLAAGSDATQAFYPLSRSGTGISFSRTVEEMIKHSYVLGKFNRSEIDEMVHPNTSMKIEQGQVLLEQGEHYDFMIGIVEGTVDIFVANRWVGHVGSGRILGELAMMSMSVCEYTAIASKDLVCVEVWYDVLERMLEDSEEDWNDCLAAFRKDSVDGGCPKSSRWTATHRDGNKHWGIMRQMLKKQGSKIAKSQGLLLAETPQTSKKMVAGHWHLERQVADSSPKPVVSRSLSRPSLEVRPLTLSTSVIEEDCEEKPLGLNSPPLRSWRTSPGRQHESHDSTEVTAQNNGYGSNSQLVSSEGPRRAPEVHVAQPKRKLEVHVAQPQGRKKVSLSAEPRNQPSGDDKAGTAMQPRPKPKARQTTMAESENRRRPHRADARIQWQQGTTPLYIQDLYDELASVPVVVEESKSSQKRRARAERAARQQDQEAEGHGLKLRHDVPPTFPSHITDAQLTNAIDLEDIPNNAVVDLDVESKLKVMRDIGTQEPRKAQPRNRACKKWQRDTLHTESSFDMDGATYEISRAKTVGGTPGQGLLRSAAHARGSTHTSTTASGWSRRGQHDRCKTAKGHDLIAQAARCRPGERMMALGHEQSAARAADRDHYDLMRTSSGSTTVSPDPAESGAGRAQQQPIFAFEILLESQGLQHFLDDEDGHADAQMRLNIAGRRLRTGASTREETKLEDQLRLDRAHRGIPASRGSLEASTAAALDECLWRGSRQSQRKPATSAAAAAGAHLGSTTPQAFLSVLPMLPIRGPSLQISDDASEHRSFNQATIGAASSVATHTFVCDRKP